ncbi:FG-GAP-like repeat-containing protein [Edaphobacter albus]|uniref:FG-GAP-like repeat-containing protein n=1 Tax=Edaphobacter sp. 4G125 TaxID=2763071 RepID=UPI001648718A|nr:FG-GAP-like repeat-containing protein [Edaphobacter sp. 4G125]QNI36461.1 VCBS repeat-containing protein [Edaphobacter sp. 4G125]
MRQNLLLLIVLFIAEISFASGPSFNPDVRFTGSSIKGWHTLGESKWSADTGTITGRPVDDMGGWLVLGNSYQDISFYTEFRCEEGCETGVLLRAEKTPDGGMKGVYVSLDDSVLNTYAVKIDSSGRIVKKDKLPRGGLLARVTPPPSPSQSQAGNRPRPQRPSIDLPVKPADTSLRPHEWNSVEIFFDTNTVRSFLNDGHQQGAIAEDGGYGPVALHVGGKGAVHFRGLAYMDMSLKVRDEEKVGPHFRKQRLSDFYYSWGTAAADFNQDGVLDVISGPYIYYGPDYRKSREIYVALASNPTTEFATDSTMEFAADFNGDGWPDVLTVMFGGDSGIQLYINPKGEGRRWQKYVVGGGVQSEIAVLRDIDGDGKPELIYSGDGRIRYAKPDPAKPTEKWIVHDISESGYGAGHGIGVGDINGDGRMDIVNPYGWWEQPAAGADSGLWTYHPAAFAKFGRGMMGGSVMAVYDANGDGLNDIVTSLNAHGWGLAWYEQKRDAAGEITFTEHMIMDDRSTKNAGGVTFSELHGTGYADVDGDGIPDFIAGKRYFSHLDTNLDPDPRGAPVLYWYKTVRNHKAPGGAELLPQLIDTHSGVGSDVLAVDLNHDGAIDVVTSTRFGTFIYWGIPRRTGSVQGK